jgi:MFS transporter, DHA3 family, macrolide efflux protein
MDELKLQKPINLTIEKPKLFNRNFIPLFVGGLISDIGANFTFIAILFLAISKTSHLPLNESAQAVALISLMTILPSAFIGPFAGAIVDRFDRKKIMFIANLIGAFTVFSFILATNMIQVYIITFFAAFNRIFFYPSRGASLPIIVGHENLVRANSLVQTNIQLSALIGPALAGLAISFFGLHVAFLIDGISLLISATLILTINSNLKPKNDGTKTTPKQILIDFKEGINIVKNDQVITFLILSFILLILGIGMLNPILAFYLSTTFGLGEREFGFLISFSALSGVIGALLISLKGKIKRKLSVINFGIILAGISVVLLGIAPFTLFPIIMLFFAMGLIGLVNISINIPLQSLMQTLVENKHLGKVGGLMGTTIALTQSVSTLVASALVLVLPIYLMMIVIGVFLIMVAFLCFVIMYKKGIENNAIMREFQIIEHKNFNAPTIESVS